MNLNRSNREELFLLLRAMGCSFSTETGNGKSEFLIIGFTEKNKQDIIGKVNYYFPNNKLVEETATFLDFKIA